MGISVYCSCYDATAASNLCLFAETADGKFGQEIPGSTNPTLCETTSTAQIRIVSTPLNDSYYSYASWGSPSSYATATNYGLLTITKSDSSGSSAKNHNKAKASLNSGLTSVTVKDEHGTHSGLPSGTWKMRTYQVIAVKHKSTDGGYTFTGWKFTFKRGTNKSYPKFLSTFGSGEADTSGDVTTITSDYAEKYAVVAQLGSGSTYSLEIEAVYAQGAVEYTLSYDKNGGDSAPSSQKAKAGDEIILASKISRSGYTFDGWEILGTVYGAETPYTMPSRDVTAKATWTSTSRTYRLNYSGLSGASPSSYSQQQCTTGNSFTLNGNPTKSGYEFTGWELRYSSSSGALVDDKLRFKGDTYSPSGSTTTYYAVATWGTPTPRSLTYYTGYEGGTAPDKREGLTAGQSITLASALMRTGYTFGGWKIDGKTYKAGATYTMPPKDVEATGQWKAQSVTLTYKSGYSPETTYSTVTGKYAGNTITLLAAKTRSGYNFTGWLISYTSVEEGGTVAATYKAGTSYVLKASSTATAQWSPLKTFTISYQKNGSDVTGVEIPITRVSEGKQAVIREADLWKRPNYQFVRWSTNTSGTGTTYNPGDIVSPTGSLTLYAIWMSDTRSGYVSSYSKTVLDTSYPDNNYMMQTPGATIALLTNARDSVNVSYETRKQGVGGYYSSGTYYSYRQTTYSPSGNQYSYSSPLSYGAKITATATANQSVLYPGGTNGTEISYYSYSYSGYDYTTHEYGMGSEYSRSNSLDDSWKWTAPVLANYEFQGWYTLDKAYTSAHSPTADEFHLLVSKEKTIKWGDFKDRLNYVRHTARTDLTGSYEYGYTNYLYLKYLGKKVVVLLDAGDGTVDPFFVEVRYGATYGVLPSPTPPSGRTFSGWYTAETGGSAVSSSTPVSDPNNHTLYARYSGSSTETVTVTFDGMGGTPSYSSRTYTVDSTYSTLPTCSRTGYSSYAWYTEPYGGTVVTTSTKVQKMTPQTLFAHWTVGKYTITLDPNGGTIDTTSIQVVQGAALAWIPTPSLANKYFVGWFTSKTGGDEVTTTTVPTKNMTIYARWSDSGGGGGGGGEGGGSSDSSSEERGYVRAYGIVLKSNESFEVDRAYERKYKTLSGGALPTAAQVTKKGYVFMGWYKDAAFTDGPYTEVPAGTTGKVTYYARFIKQG